MKSNTIRKNKSGTARAKEHSGLLPFTCLFKKEKGGYVVRCVELDITSQGDTLKQAKENIREAINLYLECYKPPAKSLGIGPPQAGTLYRKIDQYGLRKGR